MGNRGLRRFSVAVAVCAFLLVIAGGLVTSNDAALSIPDWPLAWGKLIPPLEGGIRYEFGHRLLAFTVAVLSIILAIWSRRKLAWLAVGAILAQALVGGLLVKFVEPTALVLIHACLAELCFGLLVAVAVGPSRGQAWAPAPLIAAAALFGQSILGAAVRHGVTGVLPHIAGAAVATVLVMWAGLSTLMHHMENPPLRRSAMALLSLTFSQVFLGIGAYMARVATAGAPQPMPMMVWFTVAHVAVGSLAFGAAVVLAMVSRQTHPMEAQLAHGGMVVA
jgi:cytochrome c oxidase assembly protein subunit 15